VARVFAPLKRRFGQIDRENRDTSVGARALRLVEKAIAVQDAARRQEPSGCVMGGAWVKPKNTGDRRDDE
jgi:copper(I)-binding protein